MHTCPNITLTWIKLKNQTHKIFRSLKRPYNKRALNINNKIRPNDISNEFAHHFNYLLNNPRIDESEQILMDRRENDNEVHALCESEHFSINPKNSDKSS